MNNKSLDDIKIDQSKFKADGQKYFGLFEKHIPRNLGGESNVLLYSLNNEDCIMNIVALNPEARYFVYDHEHLKYLREISPQTRFVFMHDDGSDKVGAFKNMFCQLSSKYNIDMKFDCIIMNPPYQRGLHLKILNEVFSHISTNGKIVSLQPINKWQEALLNNKPSPVNNAYIHERISMDYAKIIFNIEQRSELGIITNNISTVEIIDNFSILLKIRNKLINAVNIGGLLKDKLESSYKDYPVNFGYGVTIAGNGGHGKACYRLLTNNEIQCTRKEEIGHCKRYNAKNKTEQHMIWEFYRNQMIRFIAKEFGFGGIPYNIIPNITGFIDNNNKTPLDYVWSFFDMCKYFDLSLTEIQIINESLKNYLHEDEQKIIEETMAKYK